MGDMQRAVDPASRCRWRTLHAMVLAVTALIVVVPAQTTELEREIQDLKARITEARGRIEEVKKEITRDQASSEDHRKQLSAQQAGYRSGNDSLGRELRRLRLAADSVGRLGQELQARQAELDNRQKAFVKVLLAACDSLDTLCTSLPPAMQQQRSALRFLRAELATTSVEPGEALERLWHLHQELDLAAGLIDVYSETSPTPLLAGQVDLVRLGLCYLAGIDEQQRAAIWTAATGDSAWVLLGDDDAAALRTAIQVRRGNMVPQIVNLPVRGMLAADTITAGVAP